MVDLLIALFSTYKNLYMQRKNYGYLLILINTYGIDP